MQEDIIEMDGYVPLSNIEFDKLNFATKAKEIAKFIESVPNTIPYAVTINGSWGSGKSTMLNFKEEARSMSNYST